MIKFLKNWWEVIVFALVLLALRLFVFSPILVDGHSMDPTLQDGERMIMVKTAKIERFDIVVSGEPNEPKKNIIKRVIGMPGDTIKFDNDQLYINGKKTDEPYLDKYKALWKKTKLFDEYNFNAYFQELAKEASAFTMNSEGDATFEVKVPEGHYFLMGDDRLVSKDSRDPAVGPIEKKQLKGEAKLAFWPLNRFKLM
ncbi:signal peptidase. Serine peptidase. MEROPS family S26A [Pilibacter termitis]|uniref:Signal peptidase I n=1 Tax=Pilibacter termitis TaxID=263852 RepID=A0A1T4KGA6_9ENTE|nr:signal peptidase I [Pilibacter termitis]SJZ41468.1 signal peptidase. Serine peptidase. MEROPS family S26A [Pilibacter termitis]